MFESFPSAQGGIKKKKKKQGYVEYFKEEHACFKWLALSFASLCVLLFGCQSFGFIEIKLLSNNQLGFQLGGGVSFGVSRQRK